MGRQMDIDISGRNDLGPELDKDKGDHILWSSKSGDCTIIFNHTEGTPFAETHFQLLAGATGEDSGLVTKGKKGQSYRYSIYARIVPKIEMPLANGSPKVRIKP